MDDRSFAGVLVIVSLLVSWDCRAVHFLARLVAGRCDVPLC